METIKTWISKILSFVKESDKVKHILVNFAIVLVVGIFNLLIGVMLAIIASLSKETYDEYVTDGSGWNWKDLIADLIGIILGILILL